MVNNINSTNINKTKGSLISDGQQFHQYQQNELSLLTLTHWRQRMNTTNDIENSGPGLEQA